MPTYPEQDPEEMLKTVHERVLFAQEGPNGYKYPCPVFPLAPKALTHCSLPARSKSIKILPLSSLIMRLGIDGDVKKCKL